MAILSKNELAESICLLNLSSPTPEETERTQLLIFKVNQDSAWDTWLDLVKLNACESLVYLNILKYKSTVPDSVTSELKKTYNKIEIENSLRNSEAKVIFSQFYADDIPFVILKGQALAEYIYGSLFYKKMNDVDFLVQKKSLDKLEVKYKSLQLECAASIGGNNFRKQESFSHHWPPFFTRNLDCVLGTHWNITTPLSPIKISETDLWNNTVPHSYLGIPCLRLNDLYFFFHLTVHLAYYKTGLKEFCDPINWFRSKKNSISPEAFLELVNKTKAYDPVFRSLYCMNRISPDPTFKAWINAIESKTSRFVVNDTLYRGRELYYIVRSRSTQTSRIEKSFALFSLADLFYEKFFFLGKMWKHFLFPKLKDVLYMQSLPDNPNPFLILIGYAKTPYLLSRVFAFDLGWRLHFLLIAKHHIDLIQSFFVFAVSAVTLGNAVPFPMTLKKKFKSLNLPVDSIEQIKNKLE